MVDVQTFGDALFLLLCYSTKTLGSESPPPVEVAVRDVRLFRKVYTKQNPAWSEHGLIKNPRGPTKAVGGRGVGGQAAQEPQPPLPQAGLCPRRPQGNACDEHTGSVAGSAIVLVVYRGVKCGPPFPKSPSAMPVWLLNWIQS